MTTGDDAFPPFAAVYGAGTAASQTMTPRMACHLWAAAIFFADTWRMTRDEPDLLHDWLPPVARPHAHGPWLDQLIDCLERLSRRRKPPGSQSANRSSLGPSASPTASGQVQRDRRHPAIQVIEGLPSL